MVLVEKVRSGVRMDNRSNEYENIAFNGGITPTAAEAMFEDGHITCSQF
jgi:hypothetical protein